METMDQLFLQINRTPLTAKIPTKKVGKGLKIKNEIPLISQSVANAIATTAWAIASPRGQQNIQRTVERSVNRKFLPYVNAIARGDRKSMMHMYEWGMVGVTAGRLFDLVIPQTSRGKTNFSMKIEYRPSKKLVPLTEAQATPNPVTGAVVKKQHIFYNKAMVMENGLTVMIRPKQARYLAFDNPPGASTKSGLTFSSRPIVIKYAGRPTYHAMRRTIESFFSGVGGQDIDRSLKDYGKTVRRGVAKSVHMINVSVPSDEFAHSVAKRISGAMMPGG